MPEKAKDPDAGKLDQNEARETGQGQSMQVLEVAGLCSKCKEKPPVGFQRGSHMIQFTL